MTRHSSANGIDLESINGTKISQDSPKVALRNGTRSISSSRSNGLNGQHIPQSNGHASPRSKTPSDHVRKSSDRRSQRSRHNGGGSVGYTMSVVDDTPIRRHDEWENQDNGDSPSRRHHSTERTLPIDNLNANQVSDIFARTIKRAKRHRAKVTHLRIGVQEQTEYVRFKQREVREIMGRLQKDPTLDPHVTNFSPDRMRELLNQMQKKYSEVVLAEQELEDQTEALKQQEGRLRDVEDEMYGNVTGEQAFTMDDFLDAVFDRPSPGPASLRRERIEGTGHLNETHASLRASTRATSRPRSHSHDWHRQTSDAHLSELDGEHVVQQSPLYFTRMDYGGVSFHSPGFAAPDPFQPEDQESLLIGIGAQFSASDKEIGPIIEQSIQEYTPDPHVQAKRRHDIQAKLETKLEIQRRLDMPIPRDESALLDVEERLYSEVVLQSTGFMVGRWMFRTFACSWLELSRFIFAISDLSPIIEAMVDSCGYIHFATLVRANWILDEQTTESDHPRSVYPTLSINSEDVPLQFQQIVTPDSQGSYGSGGYYPASGIERPAAEITLVERRRYGPPLKDHLSSNQTSHVSYGHFSPPTRATTFANEDVESLDLNGHCSNG